MNHLSSSNHISSNYDDKHGRIPPPRPSIDPSMVFGDLFPTLKINIPIRTIPYHNHGISAEVNAELLLNNRGTILEASTGKSIARVSMMTLVALECMAFIDIVVKCGHDCFTDNIIVAVDRTTLNYGCQPFICNEFYEDFVDKRPWFPWGDFKTKQERLNGICINDISSTQQDTDTRGLIEVCNDMMTRLQSVL